MEISKTEKVNLNTIRIRGKHSTLRVRILSLEPGQAFTVKGRERHDITAITSYLQHEDHSRQFATKKLGLLEYQVIRIK